MRFDHLILAASDLEVAAAALRRQTGLEALPGGVHPDWGTRNAIVPLGDAYLELVTVEDRERAATAPFGRVVAAAPQPGAVPWTLVGWAVRVDDLDATAARVGVDHQRGRRRRPDGSVLSWQMAGVDEAVPRGLPFFLRWDDDGEAPFRASAPHAVDPTGIAWLEVGGDRATLAAWLGAAHGLDLRVLADAPPGPRRAAIGLRAGGELVLDPTL